MSAPSHIVRFLGRWPSGTLAARTQTQRRAISTTSSASKTAALHTHAFLSAKEAFLAAASNRSPTSSSSSSSNGGRRDGNAAAALTFTLPPLCVWGAAQHSHNHEEHQRHVGRHSASSASSHYGSLWSPIEDYLAQLSNAPLQTTPPVCVALRLFPDLTVAQLPTTVLRSAPTDAGDDDRRGDARTAFSQQPGRRRRRRTRLAAPHEQPLAAILATENPWGSGADPQLVFRHALQGLREVGQHLLPQVPLVLQLPTRLLVSQQFLEDVATLLVRSGWRSVAFELPSTHQLYGPFQSSPLDELHESRAGQYASSAPSSDRHDSGAVDAAWCRLPLLCTPWPVLCRHPSLGPSLRHLRRHDVVPFHVLFSWALTEARLFHAMDQSLVLDVTAPLPGTESTQARQQGPRSVGVSAAEARRAAPASNPTPTQANDVLPEIRDHAWAKVEEQAAHDGDDDGGDDVQRPLHVYMSEDPTMNRRTGVALSSGVTDAVRRHHGNESTSTKADLGHAEAAWRRRQQQTTASITTITTLRQRGPTTSPTPVSSSSSQVDEDDEAASPLILDAPPEHLRALIERSITQDGTPDPSVAAATLTPRQRLLQRVGRFMQHTLQHDASVNAETEEKESEEVGDSDTATTTTAAAAADAELEREAVELEELLQQANDTSDAAAASGNVEHMMAEMQRYMHAHAPGTETASSTDKNNGFHEVLSSPTAPPADAFAGVDVWSPCKGYWACVCALLFDTTHASLVWTLPTYNAAAVRTWAEAYAVASNGRAATDSSNAADATSMPPVVPVWMPLQSVMHTEVERLLREGRQFPQPPQNASAATHEARTWLPRQLNEALHGALAQLPAEVQASQRRCLLRDYRVLRSEGAQGARGGSCEIHRPASAAPTQAAAEDSHSEAPAVFPVVSSADESGDQNVEDSETSEEVRIRPRRGTYPFYLLPPSQVAKVEVAAERRLVEEANVSSTESAAGNSGKALLATVREVNDMFLSEVAAYYGNSDSPSQQPASLYVPTPGIGTFLLHRSWQAVP